MTTTLLKDKMVYICRGTTPDHWSDPNTTAPQTFSYLSTSLEPPDSKSHPCWMRVPVRHPTRVRLRVWRFETISPRHDKTVPLTGYTIPCIGLLHHDHTNATLLSTGKGILFQQSLSMSIPCTYRIEFMGLL